MLSYAVALWFPFTGHKVFKKVLMFQHDNVPMRSIKTWIGKVGVEELKWPAQSSEVRPTEHLWDELEELLHARPSWPTSVPDLTKALFAEWAQNPTATLQNLVESTLLRRMETVIATKGGTKLIPMVLELEAQQAHLVVIIRCPHTFLNFLEPGAP